MNPGISVFKDDSLLVTVQIRECLKRAEISGLSEGRGVKCDEVFQSIRVQQLVYIGRLESALVKRKVVAFILRIYPFHVPPHAQLHLTFLPTDCNTILIILLGEFSS